MFQSKAFQSEDLTTGFSAKFDRFDRLEEDLMP